MPQNKGPCVIDGCTNTIDTSRFRVITYYAMEKLKEYPDDDKIVKSLKIND